MKVRNFADLMAGHKTAEILCAVKLAVVRRLKVSGNMVRIDACDGPMIQVPLDTPISYEPWFMDRGSLLFDCQEVPSAKICTEADLIRFPDGSEEPVLPDA